MAFLDVALDVRPQLNELSDVNEAELQRFTDAACSRVEAIVGPVTPRAATAWLPGGGAALLLPESPVISVESVTEYRAGSAAVVPAASSPADGSYRADLEAGILWRWSGCWPRSGTGADVLVAYTVGRLNPPEPILLGTLIIIQHLWATTQQGGRRPVSADDGFTGAGFAVPNRALEMLEPYLRPPRVG